MFACACLYACTICSPHRSAHSFRFTILLKHGVCLVGVPPPYPPYEIIEPSVRKFVYMTQYFKMIFSWLPSFYFFVCFFFLLLNVVFWRWFCYYCCVLLMIVLYTKLDDGYVCDCVCVWHGAFNLAYRIVANTTRWRWNTNAFFSHLFLSLKNQVECCGCGGYCRFFYCCVLMMLLQWIASIAIFTRHV